MQSKGRFHIWVAVPIQQNVAPIQQKKQHFDVFCGYWWMKMLISFMSKSSQKSFCCNSEKGTTKQHFKEYFSVFKIWENIAFNHSIFRIHFTTDQQKVSTNIKICAQFSFWEISFKTSNCMCHNKHEHFIHQKTAIIISHNHIFRKSSTQTHKLITESQKVLATKQ